MKREITRRALLAGSLPGGAAYAFQSASKAAKSLPAVGEFVRFVDPVTESVIVRLTTPSYSTHLPKAAGHAVSLRDRFLLVSSDRSGTFLPYSIDLRSGVWRQLAVTERLKTDSLSLDATARQLYFIDGSELKQIALNGKKASTLADGVQAFSLSGTAVYVVRNEQLESVGSAHALAKNVASWCLARPKGTGCAFGRELTPATNETPGEQEFWYVPLSGERNGTPVRLAGGFIWNPLWSPDGSSLLFLRQFAGPSTGTNVTEIREVVPETGVEQKVAKTSQFAAFAVNGDGSVFVGASASKAQPTVVLLLRSVQREFTLCEHRAKPATAVRPEFSPDSRRVYFQSNRDGKFAVYSVNVETLVEPTAPGSL